MINFLKIIFYFGLLCLAIISLYPGSLIGYLLYGDFNTQPHFIKNPFGTTINHFIYYIFISLLGFFIYYKNFFFKKLFYGLYFLAIMLEFAHYIVPNRSFELADLVANILGVTVAYSILKIYLFIKNYE